MGTMFDTPPPITKAQRRSARRGLLVMVTVYLLVAAVNATLLYRAAAEAAEAVL